jgi:hypothetical protein
MDRYYRAGLALDIPTLETLYAPDFENIRLDRSGRMVVLSKADFMAFFHGMLERHESHGPSDDIQILYTTVYDDHGSVLVRRNEHNQPALYNFVWRMQDGKPTALVREFTVEEHVAGAV